jgi:uncharacterized heparinase superfamily protein
MHSLKMQKTSFTLHFHPHIHVVCVMAKDRSVRMITNRKTTWTPRIREVSTDLINSQFFVLYEYQEIVRLPWLLRPTAAEVFLLEYFV